MGEPAGRERFRLFVALLVPEEVKDRIESAQVQLRRAVPEGLVRWTRREQFHLTLKFLGNVDSGLVTALTATLNGACRGGTPLRMVAKGLGCFPNLRMPRVVWAGAHDTENRLAALHAIVEAAVREFTAEEPEERFSGHVTLGRIKGIRRSEAAPFADQVSHLADLEFGEWRADSIELIRSVLSPTGPSYTSLAAIPLS